MNLLEFFKRNRATLISLFLSFALLAYTIFFTLGSKNNFFIVILVSSIVVIANVLIIISKKFFNLKIHSVAFLVIMTFGVINIFVSPILNAPDENAHLARAEITSNFHFFIDTKTTLHPTIKSVNDLSNNVQKSYINSTLYGKKIDKSPSAFPNVAASNPFYLYIPQAIGVFFAKLFNMDAIFLLWLGSMFNLISYAFIVAFSIKIIPELKIGLFFVAALPISIQQASSLSPDALINSSAFLLVAYTLYLFFEKEKYIGWKEVSLYFALAMFVSIGKITNILLAALILIIPKHRFKIKFQLLIKISILFVVFCCGLLYFKYTSSFVTNLAHLEYLKTNKVNSNEQIKYILSHPVEFSKNFIIAIKNNIRPYLKQLNTYGWLNYSYHLLSIIFLFVIYKVSFVKTNFNIGFIRKSFISLLCLGIFIITNLALYLTWTRVGSVNIDGVQGRYFIPCISLIPLIFSKNSNAEIVRIENNDLENNIVPIISSTIGCMIIVTACQFY